jgi:hypothetical protein
MVAFMAPICSRFQLTARCGDQTMPGMRGATLLLLAFAALIVPDSVPAATAAQEQAWVETASTGLDPRAVDALRRIVGADRRLLALRAYLRAGDSLPERWSWSQERLSAYATTPEGKAASADIDAVATAFAAANPGFTLTVNRQPRSLELQIAHWNQNPSVARVAAELAATMSQRFPAAPAPSTDELRHALMDWRPNVAAALAAPGLSAHGQGRAFDFQIEHRGQVVAGTEVASARQRWDAAGWTQKLHQAMSTAGPHFTGPLAAPYEPWHYAYTPAPGRYNV